MTFSVVHTHVQKRLGGAIPAIMDTFYGTSTDCTSLIRTSGGQRRGEQRAQPSQDARTHAQAASSPKRTWLGEAKFWW